MAQRKANWRSGWPKKQVQFGQGGDDDERELVWGHALFL